MKSAPISLIIHRPTAPDGKIALAKQAAEVHSSAVTQHLKRLNIPNGQKQALLDAAIQTVKQR